MIIRSRKNNYIKIREFRERVINWYDMYGDKNLPWRNTADPWAILVASFLLRKTTTRQVIKIYDKFMKTYPSPERLLRASVNDLKELIRPLGIENQRAKHLKELAKVVMEEFQGVIPCNKNLLKRMPGVGDYIASEILLLACGKAEPLLDRNMIRVLERVLGLKSHKKRAHTDKELWNKAKEIMPKDPNKAKKFNLGILDFARKVCLTKKPKCTLCPLTDICSYYNKQK